MKSSAVKVVIALGIVAIGVCAGVLLIGYSEADDAPGGVLLGYLLIGGALVLGAVTARRKA